MSRKSKKVPCSFLPQTGRKEASDLSNPHFDIVITQRSKRKSEVAGAAYQSGEKMFSEYDQKTKNYTHKRGIVYTEIMLPAMHHRGMLTGQCSGMQ